VDGVPDLCNKQFLAGQVLGCKLNA